MSSFSQNVQERETCFIHQRLQDRTGASFLQGLPVSVNLLSGEKGYGTHFCRHSSQLRVFVQIAGGSEFRRYLLLECHLSSFVGA